MGTFLNTGASRKRLFLNILSRPFDQFAELSILLLSFEVINQQSIISQSYCKFLLTQSLSLQMQKYWHIILNNNLLQMKILLISCLLWIAISAPKQTPVIGIYTQTDSSDQPKALYQVNAASNYSYIAASYVKYIEMSGAQVVPIFGYTKDKSYFDTLLPKINGVLFPGGGTAIDIKNIWTSNADYILKYAINQNKNGNPFPVWGTCLGWQLLAYLTSGYDSKVLSPVRGQSGVKNRVAIKTPTYLYDGIPNSVKTSLENGNGIVYFNHVWAVSTDYYQSNQLFRSFWNITSTTTSSYNEQFISAAESKEYPIYGIQFHPQKNLFEWKVSADRSENGAQITQILSNKFVEKARGSKNGFKSLDEQYKAIIFNYKTQKTTQSFSEIYLFHEVNGVAQDKPQQKNLMVQ